MEKLTEPINIYFEGSQGKGQIYREQLRQMGYEVNCNLDLTDKSRFFYNYPGTFSIIETNKDSVKRLVIQTAQPFEKVRPQLRPFDKVLGRNVDEEPWRADFFSHYSNAISMFVCIGSTYTMVIPFEGNEDRVGMTDMEYIEHLPF